VMHDVHHLQQEARKEPIATSTFLLGGEEKEVERVTGEELGRQLVAVLVGKIRRSLATQALEPREIAGVVGVAFRDAQEVADIVEVVEAKAIPIDDRAASKDEADLLKLGEAEWMHPRGLRAAVGS
jgi:hypothetical protein